MMIDRRRLSVLDVAELVYTILPGSFQDSIYAWTSTEKLYFRTTSQSVFKLIRVVGSLNDGYLKSQSTGRPQRVALLRSEVRITFYRALNHIFTH